MTDEEKAFAGKFHFEDDRIRFSVARHGLRLLLSKYLSVDPATISISNKPGQKPTANCQLPTTNCQLSTVHFNISHSGEWVLIALAKEEVGVDIEYVNRAFDYTDLLEDHFSEAEQEYISQAKDSVEAFYYLWTRKEALTKAWGTGLQENLKQVNGLDTSLPIEKQGEQWELENLNIGQYYCAALCYSAGDVKIFYFREEKAI